MKLVFNNLAGPVFVSVLAIALVLPLSAKAAELPESDDPIIVTVLDWSQQQVMSHIAGGILESLGYNVEYISATFSPSVQGLAEGELTFAVEIFESMGGQPVAKALESGKVESLGDLGMDVREGLAYPAYMEEQCPGLPDWKALLECQEVFGTPETLPKGRIVDYPLAWEINNKIRIDAYLGDDKYALIPGGSEGAMLAEIKSAFLRKQPLLVVFWAPQWVHYEEAVVAGGGLKFVKFEPAFEAGCNDELALGAFPDRVGDCDWPREWIRNFAWAGMKDKWPVAYKVMRAFTIYNDDEQSFSNMADKEGVPIEQIAAEWIRDNEAKWRPWVDAAMAGS